LRPSLFFNILTSEQVLPHPPILRGVETVVSKLKAAGHDVFPWTPYKHGYAVKLIGGIYASDGGTDVHDSLRLSGEPAIPNIMDLLNPNLPKIDMNDLWAVHLKKWAYQSEYLEQFRLAEETLGKEIDAIVAPITATAAIRHNEFRYYGYASTINLLDFTSVVIPVLFADKHIDKKIEDYDPINERDGIVQAECENFLVPQLICANSTR
jgi:amidase